MTFKNNLFILISNGHAGFACRCVLVLHASLVSSEAGGWLYIDWDWGCGRYELPLGLMGAEPRPSSRAAHALNWAISLPQTFKAKPNQTTRTTTKKKKSNKSESLSGSQVSRARIQRERFTVVHGKSWMFCPFFVSLKKFLLSSPSLLFNQQHSGFT